MGLLGSAGGPESSSTVPGNVVLLTPSLFLGPSFLVLVVSIHQLAAPDRKVWSHSLVLLFDRGKLTRDESLCLGSLNTEGRCGESGGAVSRVRDWS